MKIVKDEINAYHASKAISSSELKAILKTPRHFIEARAYKSSASSSQKFGSLVHDVLLEDRKVTLMPDFGDQRNAKNREDKKAFFENCPTGALFVSQDDFEALEQIKENIEENEHVKELLQVSTKEMSHYFSCTMFDTMRFNEAYEFRFRPDGYDGPKGFLIELKTTKDASEEAFKKTIDYYHYDFQIAFYHWALKEFGVEIDQPPVIIAIENESPYLVRAFEIGPQTLSHGYAKLYEALDRLDKCMRFQSWPGYPKTPIRLP